MTDVHVPMRVIKVGGRAQADPALFSAVAAAWATAPRALCVVHGGGDEVSLLQRRFGVEAEFRDGRRVTSEADIDILRMALSGAASKRLVSGLLSAGVNAVGISGEDGALLVARRTRDVALGAVGEPAGVNVALLRHLLAGQYLPVISPLARNHDASQTPVALNVNGDDAAAAIAAALGANELLLVSDIAGVLVAGALVPAIAATDVDALIANGSANAGMVAKLRAAVRALREGVGRVRIGDVRALTDPLAGTEVCLSESLV